MAKGSLSLAATQSLPQEAENRNLKEEVWPKEGGGVAGGQTASLETRQLSNFPAQMLATLSTPHPPREALGEKAH